MKERIVILGAGESGVGAALLAKAKGYDVFVSDKGSIAEKYKRELVNASIDFEGSKHTEALILNASQVVKSPGIPDKAEVIQKLKESNIPVIAELEFASRFTRAKMIGITGTNGKTTTTLLTYHLLKEAGLSVGLAGNVGSSLAKQVIKDEFEFYVVEISSFQLDDMYSFHPLIAVLLNITPDHLDRYDHSMEKYIRSKFRITHNLDEKNYLIYFSDDEHINTNLQRVNNNVQKLPISIREKVPEGAFLEHDILHFNIMNLENDFQVPLSSTSFRGTHNAINAMAAVLVAFAAGVLREQILPGLQSFKNAPHRMEKVGEVSGVSFFNDSKATNVDAVSYALGGFSEPIVWIAGGIDKGNNYEEIKALVKSRVKAIVCLGKDNSRLQAFFQELVPLEVEVNSMEAAVKKAFSLAVRGEVVLLSPACSSFDLFENYEDRGDQFRRAVNILMENAVESSSNEISLK